MTDKSSKANDRQVGGRHYQVGSDLQHWDWCWQQNFDYFQGQITKYICRWRDKNGVEDLKKARHFLDKYIELVEKDATPELDATYPVGAQGPEPLRPPTSRNNSWVGFTFEGGTKDWDLYKCGKCRQEIRMEVGKVPICRTCTEAEQAAIRG